MTDPKRTWALVVGVERYDAGPEFNDLNAPAADARRFAAWLRARGVPGEQILMFVSARGAVADGERPATSAAIQDAATGTLPCADGDVLFVYWSGHGVADGRESRRLFTADASQQNLRNLDLDDLLRYLRSKALQGFGKQYVFVDACATYIEHSQTTALPSSNLPGAVPRSAVEQWVLFAASPGELARVDSKAGTGVFTRAVLNELEKAPATPWPPDAPEIKAALETAFVGERAAGNMQTPTHYWYRTGSGEVGTMSTVQRPAPQRGNRNELSVTDRRELVRALLECPSMRTAEGRALVIGDLRGEIGATMERSATPLADIQLIVRRCVDFDGGLVELLEAVRYCEGPSVPRRRLDEVAERIGIA